MADDTVKVQDTRQWLVKARADLDAAVETLDHAILLHVPGVVDSCDDTPSRSPEP